MVLEIDDPLKFVVTNNCKRMLRCLGKLTKQPCYGIWL